MTGLLGEFQRFGHRVALIDESGHKVTYADLDRLVDAAITESRLTTGSSLVLECTNTVDTIITYLAGLRAGCAVLMAGDGNNRAIDHLEAAYAPGFVKRAGRAIETRPTRAPVHPELGVLLSTSGSTGAAKGIRLSRTNLAANALSIAQYLELTERDCAPTTLPLNYSYGLSVLNSHLAVGASVWLTNKSVIEPTFWEEFAQHQCTSFAGVPHIYELITSAKVSTAALRSLRYATQAGGRLRPELVAEFTQRSQREGWQFFVMYGQTEATARISYLPPSFAAEYPDHIGVPIPGGELELRADDGSVIDTAGESGELHYRGPNVMMGYASSADDLIRGPELSELATGDIAVRNGVGLFRIVGRKSRFLKVVGLRIGLDEVEAWLHGQGLAGAATGWDDHLHVLVVVNGPAATPLPHAHELAQWLKVPTPSVTIQAVDELPRLANGKVDYQSCKELAEALDQTAPANNPGPANGESNTVESVFAAAFAPDPVTPADSFTRLGGDSLSYIKMMVDLEPLVGALPDRWEDRSIGELSALSGGDSVMRRLDMATLIRAVAITLVVVGHFGLLHYGGGGAFLLFAVAGFNFSRFQVPQILERDRVTPALSLAGRVALMTFVYLFLLQVGLGKLNVPTLFFFGNWLDPTINDGIAYWFIDVYLQMMLVLAIVLALPFLRQAMARNRPKATAIALAGSLLIMGLSPHLWDTSDLFDRLPHRLGWLFLAGMMAEQAKTVKIKLLTSAGIVVGCVWFSPDDFYQTVLIYGLLAVVWLSSVTVPVWVRMPVAQLATASLFIYLSHFQFSTIVDKTIGHSPVVGTGVALVGGMAGWAIYSRSIELVISRVAEATRG